MIEVEINDKVGWVGGYCALTVKVKFDRTSEYLIAKYANCPELSNACCKVGNLYRLVRIINIGNKTFELYISHLALATGDNEMWFLKRQVRSIAENRFIDANITAEELKERILSAYKEHKSSFKLSI
jgi:hypothetical protein